MIIKDVDLYNVRSLLDGDNAGAHALSRLPEDVRSRLNDAARTAALNTCGCEVRFNLEGPSATITLRRAPATGVAALGIAEVYYGPIQAPYAVSPCLIGPEPTPIVVPSLPADSTLRMLMGRCASPFDPHLVRIILPYDAPTFLCDIAGDVSPPRAGQTPGKVYLAYGSSITHGGCAIRPTETYAMRVAAALGLDLINLGFAGSAHLDDAMAEYIAESPDWDVATLELGINVIDQWSTALVSANKRASGGLW